MNKICFITNGLFRVAGTERVIVQLAEQFLTRQLDLDVFVPGSEDIAISHNINIPVKTAQVGDFLDNGIFYKLLHRFRFLSRLIENKSTFSGAHVFSFSFDLNVLNIILSFFTCHSPIVCEHIEYNYHSAFRRKIRIFFYGLRNVKVVCLTDRDAMLFRKHGIEAFVIPNFTEIRDCAYDKSSKNIVAIGRLCEQKNFSFLIKAFHVSSLFNLGYTLSIVGEGDQKIELESLIADVGLRDYVTIHPFSKEPEVYYRNAGLFCLTSKYEAFPMVLLEAMSYGLPILAVDCPTGPREIIKTNYDLQISEINNIKQFSTKMRDILLSEKTRINLSLGNHSDVNRYSPEVVMADWLKLLAS